MIKPRMFAATALVAFASIQCGGDNKPAEAPETIPSAEPPPEPMPETDAGMAMKAPATEASSAKAEAAAPKPEPLTDEQIATITEGVNTAEIEQAKLAQTKSKDAGVKKFAAMMITHHTAANQKQAKLKLKPAESGASTAMKADAMSTMDTLKADTGKDFDKAYIAAQITGHQKALDALNEKLMPAAKSPDLKAYLEELKPKVEMHLKEAKLLQENFDSKSSSTTTPAKPTG